MTVILLWNTKGDVWQTVHAALFHTIHIDGDQWLSRSKKDKKVTSTLYCKSSEVI